MIYRFADCTLDTSRDEIRRSDVLIHTPPQVLVGAALLARSRQLAQECLALATRQLKPPRLPHAHFALGSTLFFLGDFVLARQHLERGVALYDPQVHRSRALNDPGVSCLILTALTLWSQGYPDQALSRIEEALDLSQGLASPFSQAYALACSPLIYQSRGDPLAAQERAEAGRKLSKAQEFPYWLALSTTFGVRPSLPRAGGRKGLS